MNLTALSFTSRVRHSTIARHPQEIATVVARSCESDTDGLEDWLSGTPYDRHQTVTIKALAQEWDGLQEATR